MMMIERVAKAIYACQPESFKTPWSKVKGPARDNYLDTARCAIEAMREQTDVMRFASPVGSANWRKLIDAILQERAEAASPTPSVDRHPDILAEIGRMGR